MLAPLYMAEISPPEIRGSLLSIEQFSIVLGVVLGFWFGFLTRTRMFDRATVSSATHIVAVPGSWSWRLPLGLQLVFSAFLAIGCFFLPPSPRYLILKGMHAEAEEALGKLRMSTPNHGSSLEELVQVILLLLPP